MRTADVLIDLGYTPVEAGSAKDALRLIHEGERFDLLVTDHLIPGMTGTDLAREMRKHLIRLSRSLGVRLRRAKGEIRICLGSIKPLRKEDLTASLSQLTALA